MSKYEDPTQLDYRYGGDTVDDFAQKYMKTVAYIFSALNELRSPTGGTLTQNPEAYQLKVDDNKLYIRNQANTDWILLGDVQENFGFRTSTSDAFMHESDVADSGTAGKLIRADASGKLNADILGNAAKIADKAIQMGLDLADEDRLVYDKDTDTITNRPLQFKVDGDKIYARKDATTGWVLLGDLKQNLGFRSSTDDAFLTESDVADNGTAGKLIRADVNGKLNADILGNARKMAGKTFAPETLQDGQIPVYRMSDGTWHAENKGTVGTGKNLMIMDGDKMLGEYNGDEMKAIDIQKSSLTKALAESTGYGIVSGCEPSINGLTVTVSAGVIHTSDGRRLEVPEQSITLDAADATKPRTDVVYLDKYGKIAKLTGELGTPAVACSNTYTISTNFAAGDTVAFGGVTFTCTASTQDTANFALGSDTATSATNLATALNANTTINAIYTASAADSVITITETTAGNGNTPGTMTVTGTGVVTAGTAVASTPAATTAPILSADYIKVGTIFVNNGETSGTLSILLKALNIFSNYDFINIVNFGAKGDGVTDDTESIQMAMNSAGEYGTVYIPCGRYVVKGTLQVPEGLRLVGNKGAFTRGRASSHGNDYIDNQGASTLMIYPLDMENTTINMAVNSSLDSLNIIYPEQNQSTSGTDIKYPLTISSKSGCTFKNIMFWGAYDFIEHNGERLYIDGLFGYSYGKAIALKNCSDVSYLSNIHLNQNVARGPFPTQTISNADHIGIYIESVDGVFINNFHCIQYHTGVKVVNLRGGAEVVHVTNFFIDITHIAFDLDVNAFYGVAIRDGVVVTGWNYKLDNRVAFLLSNTVATVNSTCTIENVKCSVGNTSVWFNTGGEAIVKFGSTKGVNLKIRNLLTYGYTDTIINKQYNIVSGLYQVNDYIHKTNSTIVRNALVNGNFSKHIASNKPKGWDKFFPVLLGYQYSIDGILTLTVKDDAPGAWKGLGQVVAENCAGYYLYVYCSDVSTTSSLYISFLTSDSKEIRNDTVALHKGDNIFRLYSPLYACKRTRIIIHPGNNVNDSISISRIILSSHMPQLDAITAVEENGLEMINYISTGTAAPTSTPEAVGEEYIDTKNKIVYKAVGTSSSSDWIAMN